MSHTDQLNRPESQEANPYIYDLVCTRVPNQFSGGIHNPLSACGKGCIYTQKNEVDSPLHHTKN